MGGSLSEGLRVVFAIVLSCLVIGFVFMVWNSVKESGNTALTDTNTMVTQMDEAKYTQYDGAIVTGAEVINVIRQHSNDNICIKVSINGTEKSYIMNESLTADGDGVLVDARTKGNAAYISPNAKFLGEVFRDATNGTDAIMGIKFTKQ